MVRQAHHERRYKDFAIVLPLTTGPSPLQNVRAIISPQAMNWTDAASPTPTGFLSITATKFQQPKVAYPGFKEDDCPRPL